jgi:hypothetical protein
VEGLHGHVAQLELPTILELLVLVIRRGLAVDVDRRPGGDREPPVTGDVVGVVVRLEDVLDAHAGVAGHPQVLVDVEPGVHDRRHARALVPDQVRGAAEVVVCELTEQHRRAEHRTRAAVPTTSERSAGCS